LQKKYSLGDKSKIMSSNPIWYKIAENISEIGINSNNLAEIDVNGKTICLAKHGNQLFACAQKCPHAGALLSEGHMDALGNLVCPLHKYKFSLKNGRNISGEGYHLKTFNVKQNEEGVFVCLQQDGLF
jgi:nitrite reductase/ring-hydroxylating ferredoxin subunit